MCRSRSSESFAYFLHAPAVDLEVGIAEPRSGTHVDDLTVTIELDIAHEAHEGRRELRIQIVIPAVDHRRSRHSLPDELQPLPANTRHRRTSRPPASADYGLGSIRNQCS